MIIISRKPFLGAASTRMRNKQLHGYKTGEAMANHIRSAHNGIETSQACCVSLRQRMELVQIGAFIPPKARNSGRPPRNPLIHKQI